MRFFAGSLLAVLWLIARDLAGVAPVAALGLLGLGSVAIGLLAPLDGLAARLPVRGLGARGWRRIAIAIVLGPPLLFGLLRWWTEPGAPGATPAVLLGLVPPLALGASWILRRGGWATSRRFAFSCALAALPISAGFCWLHVGLGTLETVRPGAGWLHVGFFASTWVASVALLVPLGVRGWLRGGGRPASRRAAWLIGGASLGLGLVLTEADRRLLVDLYPAVHTWLWLGGLVCLDAAASVVLAGRRGRIGSLAGAGALVVLVGAGGGLWITRAALGDPGLRAELAGTALGPTLLRALPPPKAPTGEVVRHRLLELPRYLDRPDPPNDLSLLLVTVDALRADQLGPPGAPNRDAPKLEAFARRAVRFRQAWAQGSRTAIGTGTLLLGRYSANIDWNLWVYRGGRIFDRRTLSSDQLTGRFVHTTVPTIPPEGTLAERLRAAGFVTLAVPYAGSNQFFRRGVGFDRGFTHFRDLTREKWRPPTSRRVAQAAAEQLQALGPRERFFQWVHFYDPHEAGRSRRRYGRLVRAFDRGFGLLLATLKTLHRTDRTVVVLTADHGEAFGEHRHTGHATSLYEEQVRVPLLIALPGVPPRDERRPVAAIDVAATLLSVAGASTAAIDGTNLLPLLREGVYPERRPIFTELHRYLSKKGKRTADLKAVRLDRWKLIVDRLRGTAQLFDLEADPNEAHSRVRDEPEVYEALRELLEAFVAQGEAAHPLP